MAGTSLNDPRTIARTMTQSFPGEGVRHDIIIDLGSARDESAGDVLGSLTTPTMGFTAQCLTLNWDAAAVTPIVWATQLPGEFATDGRRLAVVLSLLQNGSSDAITGTVTVYARGSDGAQKGPFTVSDVEIPAGGTGPQDVFFDFTDAEDSGGDTLEPNDALTIKFTPSAHGTDSLTLFGIRLRAHLNPALTDRDARSGTME